MYFTHSWLTNNKSHCCSFIRLMLRIIVLLPLKCKHIFRKKMPQTSWHLNRVDCGIMSWNPSHESSFHLSCQQWVGPDSGLNLFWPRDGTWRHSSGSALAQVIVGCLTSPSLHPNQCWLIIHLWHSPESDYTRNAHDFFFLQHVFTYHTFKIPMFPRRQWVQWTAKPAKLHISVAVVTGSNGEWRLALAVITSQASLWISLPTENVKTVDKELF